MASKKKTAGAVTLVGTGPGDTALLTMRAAEVLAGAELVVGTAEVLAAVGQILAPTVETRPGAGVSAAIAEAKAGRPVLLAYAGDVLFSAAGVEDARALAKAKVPFEVVPGVGLAAATAAFAGVAAGGAIATMAEVGEVDTLDWGTLAATTGTLLLTIPAARAGKAAMALTEHGRLGDEPVTVTTSGATTAQRTVTATLDTLGEAVEAAGLGADGVTEALLVVGPAVAGRAQLSWWESRPLFGMTVLVPRTRAQAGETSALLRTYGARPLEVPTIAVEPPRTPAPMERAIKGLVSGRYAWVAFTSANAVKAVREQLEGVGLDARAFAGVRVAAVGPATADALVAFGIRADLVPSGEPSSEGLLREFPEHDEVLDPLDRVFLPRADIATETLIAGLKERGWAIDDVTAYRTVRAAPPAASVREAIKGGRVDAALFTSSSTVRNLVGIAGKPHERTLNACIGPQTAATARELGLRVDVQPRESTVTGLVAELAELVVARRAEQARAATGALGVPAAAPAGARKRNAKR